VAEGSKRVAFPEKTTAAAVHLTSDDADYIHATALHIDGGRLALLIGAPYQAVGQGCCGGATSAASLRPS
jgi:hypothetical protein